MEDTTTMKHTLLYIAVATLALIANVADAKAQGIADGQVKIKNTNVELNGKKVDVSMDICLDDLDLAANRGLVLTPLIVCGEDTAELETVEVLGRLRYLYYEREGKTTTDNPSIVERRYNGKAQTINYQSSVAYQEWMGESQLIMAEGKCKCNQQPLGPTMLNAMQKLDLDPSWHLQYAYAQPAPEPIKIRDVSGSARLQFALDKYDIRPNFAQNAQELDSIRRTIDLVRTDHDVHITSIALHGYASPDGSYSHNEVLAANRTKALRQYLVDYYTQLDPNLFSTASTAEDWEGTRKFFAGSTYDEKDAILRLIDSNLTPDQKDRSIASKYPAIYRVLIDDIYPTLRRTDYTVTFRVDTFNIEQARRIIRERPQKLSQQEMYRVANSYEVGSEDFNHVFDVAVLMFPTDKIANLNAANVALQRNDLSTAKRYLDKADSSAEAQNARGVLALMQEDYTTARSYFEAASNAGLSEAAANLKELDRHQK